MRSKPLILITNDDGYLSPGLAAAAEAAADLGDLLIAAPLVQQTGMGRARPRTPTAGIIAVAEVKVHGRAVPAYAVDGSPALAVMHALLELTDRKPDLCISGVNYGENIGSSLMTSGTVGAALEAAANDIPAIAVSLQTLPATHHSADYPAQDWAAARYFAGQVARRVLASGLPKDVAVLNVNVPEGATPSTVVRQTTQSRQQYYVYRRPGSRDFASRLRLELDVEVDPATLEPDSDIYALTRDKCVSVTPLRWSMTSGADVSELCRWLSWPPPNQRRVGADRSGATRKAGESTSPAASTSSDIS
jgi:5'-nucleotidase